MNQEEIRKQFEMWADENEYALDRSDINKEIYRNNLTRNAWLGYQAALTSKQEHKESNQEAYSDLLQQSKDKFELKFCGNSIEADWIYSDLLGKFSLLNQHKAIEQAQDNEGIKKTIECEEFYNLMQSYRHSDSKFTSHLKHY